MSKSNTKTTKTTKTMSAKTSSKVKSKSSAKTKTKAKVLGNRDLINTVRNRIVSLLSSKGGDTQTWTGSASELSTALRAIDRSTTPDNWPGSPSVMRQIINNSVYTLRRSGVRVNFSRTSDSARKRIIELVQRQVSRLKKQNKKRRAKKEKIK